MKYPITLNQHYMITLYPHRTPNYWIQVDYHISTCSIYRNEGYGSRKFSTGDLERNYPEKENLMKNYPRNSPEYYKMYFDQEKNDTTNKIKEIRQQTQSIWTEFRQMIG